jgi:ParB family chromosome partitioning protein
LFPSARKLAEEVGIDHSQLSKALSLARLPVDVLRAFQSPLDLQYRWVSHLTDALQKDPEQVLTEAKAIQKEDPRPASVFVFGRLTLGRGTVPQFKPKEEAFSGVANQKGKIVFNPKKRTVRIDLVNIDPVRFAEVEATIKKLLA